MMPCIMRRDMKRDLVDKFKQNLIRLMEAKGMNERSLSLAAGLGATAVRDIKAGKSTEPRYSTIRCLAGALGVQMTDLVPDDLDWPPLPKPSPPDSFTGEIVALAVAAVEDVAADRDLDLPPERRAHYVLRVCRWITAEQDRTRSESLPTSDELRRVLSFAIRDGLGL